MPKIPRDISGRELAQRLDRYGYRIVRQTGSHIRLAAQLTHGLQSITIPDHSDLRIGTLSNILLDISGQLGITKEQLIKEIF